MKKLAKTINSKQSLEMPTGITTINLPKAAGLQAHGCSCLCTCSDENSSSADTSANTTGPNNKAGN